LPNFSHPAGVGVDFYQFDRVIIWEKGATMEYIYIFTGDREWEERLEKGVKFAKTLAGPVLFGVNGVRAICKLEEMGFKGVNLDSVLDLPNWVERGAKVWVWTPEEWEFLKSYLPNLHPFPEEFKK
jgi:hypothetical protein